MQKMRLSMILDLKYIRQTLSVLMPNFYIFNYIIAVSFFVRGNRRMPRSVNTKNATINDFIFNRMIRNNWNALQQACVDKEYAKIFASGLSKNVKVAKTISVYQINNDTTVGEIEAWLHQFLGKRLVAKATHSSGATLFLDRQLRNQNMGEFLFRAKMNFFKISRETQYDNLEKKIIVEENISMNKEISDYKFF